MAEKENPMAEKARKLVHEIKGHVKSEVMTVTPAMAKEWLKEHENIRPINKRFVAALAHDMKGGKWKVTHQGIAFDEHDDLKDGQHRLHAVIEAGVSVRMMVSTVPGLTAQDPIDEGRRRSLALLMGQHSRTVSALGVLRFFELGQLVHRPLTLAEAQEVYEHHALYFQAFQSVPRARSIVGGAVGALIWAWPLEPERVQAFATQLATGEMIRRGDPSYAFRNWRDRVGTSRHPEDAALAACACVRAFLAGQKLNTVYVAEAGYRALVAQRRKRHIPFTPDTKAVEGIALTRANVKEREDE